MTEIKQLLIDKVLQYIDSIAVKARVTIGGVEVMKDVSITKKDVSITKNENGTLRKYIILEEEKGLLTRVALTDVEGRELYVKDDFNYQKGVHAYTIVFPITQKIETQKAEGAK